MRECENCEELESIVTDLKNENKKLLEIAEEYAGLLAEQGKIANTPYGKHRFILTGVKQ